MANRLSRQKLKENSNNASRRNLWIENRENIRIVYRTRPEWKRVKAINDYACLSWEEAY
ncbi:MAG: hypothetical protein MR852_02570 [Treponema sp.]|nr:hypothetical protein [Treponema sp.]